MIKLSRNHANRTGGGAVERVFRSGIHNVLLIVGVLSLGFFVYNVVDVFSLRWEARLLDRQRVCEPRYRGGCRYLYTVEMGGQTKHRYAVPGNVFDAADETPGNSISKTGLGFHYQVNGVNKTWGLAPYFARFGLLGALLIGLWSWHRIAEILARRKKYPLT
ncbi:hypothetical protein [Pseudomonas sp. CGJS7]|uniref:hypothetical protein n=1 Tax=Pseudomonas sp. CGJS7 TaxID=3109348 RepID=UPI00300896E2